MLRSRADVVTVASVDGSSTAMVGRVLTGFGDRLAERVAARESQLVLGLDPDPARLWPAAHTAAAVHTTAETQGASEAPAGGSEQPPAVAAARAVAAHCALALEA